MPVSQTSTSVEKTPASVNTTVVTPLEDTSVPVPRASNWAGMEGTVWVRKSSQCLNTSCQQMLGTIGSGIALMYVCNLGNARQEDNKICQS